MKKPGLNLLVVGHCYLIAEAQDKFVAMKRLCADLRVRLLTWRRSRHLFKVFEREVHPALTADEVPQIRDVLAASHMTYLLDPIAAARVLRTFKPDHIHIEEDPHSFVAVETIMLARWFCHRATISFFIWDNIDRKPAFPVNILKRMLTRFSLSRANLVICGNREAAALLPSKGYNGEHLTLPQLGFITEQFDTPPSSALRGELAGDHEVLVGFMGRLVPEKGVMLLIEALSALPHLPWKLFICGSGPLEAEIREWQKKLGARIVFKPAVPHNKVAEHLKCLDLFVLPSYRTPFWMEQFGMTLGQAMMAGVACIGSSSGSIPEVLGPGGLVFTEGSVPELTAALEKMLTSKSERDRFASAGRSFAVQRYGNEGVSAAYLDAFLALQQPTRGAAEAEAGQPVEAGR